MEEEQRRGVIAPAALRPRVEGLPAAAGRPAGSRSERRWLAAAPATRRARHSVGRTRIGEPRSRGIAGVATAAALSLAGLLSCDARRPAREPERSVTPRRGGVFRTLMNSLPSTLDPAQSDDVYVKAVVNQLFDGLINLDSNLRPMPAIAQYWEISPDKLHYRFFLRRGVRFHNGREVTSDDFVYSFHRVLDGSTVENSPGRDALHVIRGADDLESGGAGEIAGIRAVDPYTLEIDLEHPHQGFLSMLASDNLKVVPSEEVERGDADDFGKHPVGTGPFRIASWGEAEIVLSRFDGYFGTPALLDEIRYVSPDVLPETPDYFSRFEAGRLDLVPAPLDRLAAIESACRYPILRRRDPALFFVGFNVEIPPFDDRRVRLAVAHAIDRDRLLSQQPSVLTKATGLIPPGFFGYSPKDRSIPFDPAAAKRLLAESGHPDGKDLPVIPLYTSSNSEIEQSVVRNLQNVGMRVKINTIHWFRLKRALNEGFAPMFSLGYLGDVTEADDFFFTLYHSKGSSNYFHYRRPEVDSLIDRSVATEDSRVRYRMCRDIEERVIEDVPIVPLIHAGEVYVLQPDVRGFTLGPFGLGDVPFEQVWFDGRAETRP